MTATIGTFNVALLARVGDNTPQAIGTLQVPIVAGSGAFTPGEGIRVDQASTMLGVADALEKAARQIRGEYS